MDSKRTIVYEYCPGRNLLEDVLLSQTEKLGEYRAKRIAYQILTALRYLHSKNIFHGHMTPQCIVFNDYEKATIKMTGFGYHTLLSRKIENEFDKYFHPAEKFSNGEVYGSLTDIWSLGCITYFMLSGKGLTKLGSDQDLI